MAYKNPYYDASKPHHTPNGFCNIEPTSIKPAELRRWLVQRYQNRHRRAPQQGYAGFIQQWQTTADFSLLGDRLWWLGHSSVLLRLGTQTILTDPVFSKRASPVGFLGPLRKSQRPFFLQHLPKIDIVLISHNHYDHLDRYSIRQLIKRSSQTHFIVPLGLKGWMQKLGATQVDEFDWWQDIDVGKVKLTSVPAKHWSRRYSWDTNRTLWCGWMISHQQKNYYFAGDTGYSTQLAEIGQKFAIDLALLPIGAYAPRWFMAAQHIDPFEAVKLHQELACQRSLAIHWGVFELADEPLDEPPKLLQAACLQQHITADEFILLPIGGHLPLSN